METRDEHELDRIAFACVTRTLDAEELLWVNGEGTQNKALQVRIAYWQEHVTGLDHAVAEVAPPEQVWQRIESSITEQHTATKKSYAGTQKWWLSLSTAASIIMLSVFLYWQTPASITKVNLDNQWIVQLEEKQLVIQATNPMTVPAGMVCNLWFKTGTSVVGLTQLPMQGRIELDVHNNSQLHKLLQQEGTMMVTMDIADAGLVTMHNQALISDSWL